MITLCIDTTQIKQADITLKIDGNEYKKTGEAVLPAIKELLDEHELTIHDVNSIVLATGPGSFTGLKIGATIAAMLSLLLHIPINNNPPGVIPQLEYGKDLWGLSSK
jgi:tRNA threonylcarbamoyladenosine biosynthesis protein TsaB